MTIHQGQAVLSRGSQPGNAAGAVILLHGRGATAEDILSLAPALGRRDFAFLAPQAAGFAWYPKPFLAPVEENEPYLSSALSVIGSLLEDLERSGIGTERTVLLGFSQGACLGLEFVARNPRLYGAAVGLSGGLIGPPGRLENYPGSLKGTPVFLGCGTPDPHIPRSRVDETEAILSGMGAEVTKRIYPGLGHSINTDELDEVKAMLSRIAESR
jgi:phospholipase/carboxylesterase